MGELWLCVTQLGVVYECTLTDDPVLILVGKVQQTREAVVCNVLPVSFAILYG